MTHKQASPKILFLINHDCNHESTGFHARLQIPYRYSLDYCYHQTTTFMTIMHTRNSPCSCNNIRFSSRSSSSKMLASLVPKLAGAAILLLITISSKYCAEAFAHVSTSATRNGTRNETNDDVASSTTKNGTGNEARNETKTDYNQHKRDYNTMGYQFGKADLFGSGCPTQDTIRIIVSGDGSVVKFKFREYKAATTLEKNYESSSCSLTVPVSIETGRSITVYKADYRGNCRVPEEREAEATFEAEYYFSGSSSDRLREVWNESRKGGFLLTHDVDENVLNWSPCGGEELMNIDTMVDAEKSKRTNDDVTIELTSGDFYDFPRELYDKQRGAKRQKRSGIGYRSETKYIPSGSEADSSRDGATNCCCSCNSNTDKCHDQSHIDCSNTKPCYPCNPEDDCYDPFNEDDGLSLSSVVISSDLAAESTTKNIRNTEAQDDDDYDNGFSLYVRSRRCERRKRQRRNVRRRIQS